MFDFAPEDGLQFCPMDGPDGAIPFDNGGQVEWLVPEPFVCVWLDGHLDWFAKVSPEDADFALQHLWYADDRSWTNHHPYAVRKTRRGGRGAPVVVYRLHIEIMKRVGPPPTPLHTMVDHKNGDTFDCRRENLQWATPKMNRANRNPGRPKPKWYRAPD